MSRVILASLCLSLSASPGQGQSQWHYMPGAVHRFIPTASFWQGHLNGPPKSIPLSGYSLRPYDYVGFLSRGLYCIDDVPDLIPRTCNYGSHDVYGAFVNGARIIAPAPGGTTVLYHLADSRDFWTGNDFSDQYCEPPTVTYPKYACGAIVRVPPGATAIQFGGYYGVWPTSVYTDNYALRHSDYDQAIKVEVFITKPNHAAGAFSFASAVLERLGPEDADDYTSIDLASRSTQRAGCVPPNYTGTVLPSGRLPVGNTITPVPYPEYRGWTFKGNFRPNESWFHGPRAGGDGVHHGIDVFAPRLTPIQAALRACVTFMQPARQNVSFGNIAYLTFRVNSVPYFIIYAHLLPPTQLPSWLSFQTATRMVDAGDIIGFAGNTGNAHSGANNARYVLLSEGRSDHVHVEMRVRTLGVANPPLPPNDIDPTLALGWAGILRTPCPVPPGLPYGPGACNKP